MKLSATRIRALRDPGRYSDSDGLHLFIGKNGRKSWVQHITIEGRRRDIGLGGYPAVSLAQARERASGNRAAVADGKDPVSDKRKPKMSTFEEAANAVHNANKPRWRNEKHAGSWIQTLERHAFPKIGNKRIDKIGRADVLTVLTPIWKTRPETARRVRQRMRTISRWAMAHGFMETNPAGEAIDGALPPMPKVKAHLRSLPYQEVGTALETVSLSESTSWTIIRQRYRLKQSRRFLTLSICYTLWQQARAATWASVHRYAGLQRSWRIPSSH